MARRLRRTLTWLLIIPLMGWLLTLAAVVLVAQRNAVDTADAIVVLGAAQYDGRPSPVLKARLDHAVELYKQGKAPRMLVTGGRRTGDAVTEAIAGQRYAVKNGVPVNAIMLEGLSNTTLSSIQGTARILHAAKGASAPRVLLVSDPFHMLRLTVLARIYGLQPLPSPTRTSPISRNPSIALEYALREAFAIPVDVTAAMWERMVAP